MPPRPSTGPLRRSAPTGSPRGGTSRSSATSRAATASPTGPSPASSRSTRSTSTRSTSACSISWARSNTAWRRSSRGGSWPPTPTRPPRTRRSGWCCGAARTSSRLKAASTPPSGSTTGRPGRGWGWGTCGSRSGVTRRPRGTTARLWNWRPTRSMPRGEWRWPVSSSSGGSSAAGGAPPHRSSRRPRPSPCYSTRPCSCRPCCSAAGAIDRCFTIVIVLPLSL